MIQAMVPPGHVNQASHISMGKKVFFCIVAILLNSLLNRLTFLEVAYLLLNGELPNQEEKTEFDDAITHHTMVHEQLLISTAVSVVMPTQWRSCVASQARYLRSIMTQQISQTQHSARLRLVA